MRAAHPSRVLCEVQSGGFLLRKEPCAKPEPASPGCSRLLPSLDYHVGAAGGGSGTGQAVTREVPVKGAETGKDRVHSDTPKEKRKRQKCEFEVNRSRNPLLVVSGAAGWPSSELKKRGLMPARSRRPAASGCLKGVMQSVPASVVQSRGQREKQHFCPHRFPRPLPDFLETAGPRSTVPKWASHTMDEGCLVVGGRGSQNLSH